MKHAHIVHYPGATEKSLSVVASLASDLVGKGMGVSIADISAQSVINQGLPPAWLARLLGHRVFSQAWKGELTKLGVKTYRLPCSSSSSSVSIQDQNALGLAVESELLTYFRSDVVPSHRTARHLRDQLQDSMMAVFSGLNELWRERKPDLVLIPNGRTSRQKAARLVAENLGIKVELYENGRAQPNSYYRGTTQPHDRLASQAEVQHLTQSLSNSEIHELAQSWLSQRMNGVAGTNQFSALWTDIGKAKKRTRQAKQAIFFASSFDEFLAFGPMWQIDKWDHQFQAFHLIMDILESEGFELVLRLHPNLGSKSRQYFLREIRDVHHLQSQHPSLQIRWHNSSVNSYDLISEADLVVVERSTIGLEASLMEKPVLVTQASQWDLVADVRQLLAPEHITKSSVKPWKASAEGAERFVAYWMIQERPLRYEWFQWSSWNPEKAPLRMKIALLFLKNPWFHRVRLISLEWAKRRNGRFRPPPSKL